VVVIEQTLTDSQFGALISTAASPIGPGTRATTLPTLAIGQ
jgi:hypothetical protein